MSPQPCSIQRKRNKESWGADEERRSGQRRESGRRTGEVGLCSTAFSSSVTQS